MGNISHLLDPLEVFFYVALVHHSDITGDFKLSQVVNDFRNQKLLKLVDLPLFVLRVTSMAREFCQLFELGHKFSHRLVTLMYVKEFPFLLLLNALGIVLVQEHQLKNLPIHQIFHTNNVSFCALPPLLRFSFQ